MRVLINAVSAKSGGAATYIKNLALCLSQTETGNHYIFYVPGKHAACLQEIGKNITVVPTEVGSASIFKRILWDQISLRRILRRDKIDVLLSSSDFGMLFASCKQMLMVRTPIYYSPLYLAKILPKKSLRFRCEFILRRKLATLSVLSANKVATASKSMYDDLSGFVAIPPEKSTVNPFGVPLGKFRRRDQRSERNGANGGAPNKIRLLYVSEYGDYKNLITLLQGLLILKADGVCEFSLVTTADPRQKNSSESTTYTEELQLISHQFTQQEVVFTGAVPYEEIERLYGDCDIFIFPSLAESFGHPLVEAMATGLPVLASDIPVHREICGDAAIYFNPLDAKELAEKILLLVEQPSLRDQLAEIGKERSINLFKWEDHVHRLCTTLEEVAGQA